MAKYVVQFNIENGGGVLFLRNESFQVIATGRYTWRSEVIFEDKLTSLEKITVRSNRPFTVIKTIRYTEDKKREIYQEVYAPENNYWVK